MIICFLGISGNRPESAIRTFHFLKGTYRSKKLTNYCLPSQLRIMYSYDVQNRKQRLMVNSKLLGSVMSRSVTTEMRKNVIDRIVESLL